MLMVTVTLLVAIVGLCYWFLVWNFNYWRRLGVKGPRPRPVYGNFPNQFGGKKHFVYDLQNIYESYKDTENYVGIYSCRIPQLMIVDAQLMHRIYVGDFKHFHDNDISLFVDEKTDFIFANNPFCLSGEKWKERRAEITPALTQSRIRTVLPVTEKVCQRMLEFIEEHSQGSQGKRVPIDTRDLCLRFTSEVVTDCVLGLSAGSFSKEPMPTLEMIKSLFEQSFITIFFLFFFDFLPALTRCLKLRFVPKRTEDYFIQLMQDAINLRIKQKGDGINTDRIDFLNYMLHLQTKKQLTTRQLTAHTMTFLFDGFETTASILSHTLLLIGRDPERQEKLLQEINSIGALNLEKIFDLPYLDACIHETIRLFPPGIVSRRICTEPIELLNKNGESVRVEKGMVVILPTHAIMNDENHYSNPSAFDPERFMPENDGGLKKYKDRGIYYGFGEGPRICLGMRFALTQLKCALAMTIKEYEITVDQKTRQDNKYDPNYFLSRLDGGIWLNFKKRE